jgi:predicted Zn-dependent protease
MMTKFYIRSLVLPGGLVLILSQGGFARTPPSAEVSAAQAQIAQYPNSTSPYINLATAESRANHPDEAIAAASHALAMPNTEAPGAVDGRPLAYYDLAMTYAVKGNIANALSPVDAGLSRYPGSPVLSRAKGTVLIASGQHSRAGEVLMPAFTSATHTSDPNAFAA